MVIGQQSVGKEEIMPRQDAPLSGLTGARKPLSGDDLILLSQTISGSLKSTYGTLGDLLQYLFTNNPSTDGAITDLGYLKQVTTGGLLEGNGKADHPLNVKISPGAGNLLQSRVDGLYYGIEAPADISVLYVDSLLGNDSNDGTTAESPFRTLNKAFSLVNGRMNQSILLKCGNDRPAYIMDRGVRLSETANLTLRAYGDPYLDGAIQAEKWGLVKNQDGFRTYYPPASVPIQRPKLVNSFTPLNNLGYVTNYAFSVGGKSSLIFENIDLRLSALDPNNNPNLPAYTGAMFYAAPSASVVFRFCYITDDRNFPEMYNGKRNLHLTTPAAGVGRPSLLFGQTRVRVEGRSATDYRPFIGTPETFNQFWIERIDEGLGVEFMTDNIYSVMDAYGEGAVLYDVMRDDVGNVILPRSDYTHFSHPQSEIVIPNGSVTEPKIAADAVSTDKIINGAVTDEKIQSVSASKITGVIPSANLPPAAATTNVVDNLSSTSGTDALSANQGRVLNQNKLDKSGGTISGDLTIEGQTYARAVWIQSNANNSNVAISLDSSTNQVLFQHSPISGAGGFKFDKRLEAASEIKSETLKVDNGNNVTTFSHQIGGGKSLIQTDCNVFEMNRLLYMGTNTYNRATNGYSYLPNGVLLQWGVIDYSETSFLGGSKTDERYILVNFPLVFPNATLNVQTCVMAPFLTRFTDWFPQTSQISASQFYIILQNWGNASGLADKPKVQWMAIGY